MTLRDVITEKRREFWKEADTSQMGEELELIIDRIDEMDTQICKVKSELIKLNLRMDSVEFATKVTTIGGAIGSTIKVGIPPEPFPGYNELIEEAIPILKAAIAEKKRELALKQTQSSRPME